MLRVLAVACVLALAQGDVLLEKPKAPLNEARVLFSKTPLSQYAIENMEFVLEYFLVNVGDKPATKVRLDDRKGFPTQDYDLVKGLLQVHWDNLAPGENVTHSVVVKPKRFGIFNHTAAVVSYYPTEDAKEARVGYSTAPGEGTIYSQRSYERRFGQRYTTWLLFAVLIAPVTVLPFYLWLGYKNQYPESNQKQEVETKKKSK
ncbi:unnamed protein product [Bursaphelenchus okinawaensis]|uniref:Translocon-associated protein subunit beta n=1 Tax=Bursaphelenchus okinawaensis TaxID=465554 RepID=A0A811KMU4_9BILA|nr:unnamed protein product [Bursaphelenchus okinawaensis]CAG9105829.1 unnamed protein product [Bursaphelenchus okinawaensis]